MNLIDLKHRNDFGKLLNAKHLYGLGVEIGVAFGEYSETILNVWRGFGMILVDPWKSWSESEYIDGSSKIDFDGAYNYAINKLSAKPGRTIFLRQTSDDAAKTIPGSNIFDFVYIDGNHHNPQITRDLETWWPKVKSGGIFGGHDYYDLDTPAYRCEVKSAVDLFVKKNKLTLHTTSGEGDESWWIQK